jgi:hypothetical protein
VYNTSTAPHDRQGHPRRWLILGVICLALLLTAGSAADLPHA